MCWWRRLASRGQGQVPGRLDSTKLPERLVGLPGMPSDADAVYYAWRFPQSPWMLLFRSQPSKCVRVTPALKADFSKCSATHPQRLKHDLPIMVSPSTPSRAVVLLSQIGLPHALP